jgi:hypothetical protein
MGRTCSTCYVVSGAFKSENLNERDCLEDLVVDRRIILKYVLNKWVRGLNYINPYPANVENMVSS